MAIAPRFRKAWVELANVVKHARRADLLLQQAVRILHGGIPRYDWVGVYLVEGGDLVLRAWSGPEATEHTRIPVGLGICGLAAARGETVNVPDVDREPRYIACFPRTRSEIVVPLKADGRVLGEIDVDSDTPAAFGPDDEAFLAAVADLLAQALVALGGR